MENNPDDKQMQWESIYYNLAFPACITQRNLSAHSWAIMDVSQGIYALSSKYDYFLCQKKMPVDLHFLGNLSSFNRENMEISIIFMQPSLL